jgi:hypothetical protein
MEPELPFIGIPDASFLGIGNLLVAVLPSEGQVLSDSYLFSHDQ